MRCGNSLASPEGAILNGTALFSKDDTSVDFQRESNPATDPKLTVRPVALHFLPAHSHFALALRYLSIDRREK